MTSPGKVCDRWPLNMTPDRVEFHAARPTWEVERLSHMFDLVSPGMVVYDVGAECGDFTALYRTWVGDTVVPIEPQPAYWPAIRAHWHANAPAISWASASDLPPGGFVGFAAESTDLEPPFLDPLNLGSLSLVAGAWPKCAFGEIVPDFGFRHLAQQADSTPRIEIDNLIAYPLNVPAPDVIAIDVEGAEWNVLAGARATLGRARPFVYVSASPQTSDEWYGKTTSDVHDLLREYGYRGRCLAHGHEDWWFYDPT